MKIFAFILSIYILALNFTPCGDTNDVVDNSTIKFSQLSDIDHNHNALDLCSPFCHCQCCQVIATYADSDFQIAFNEISSEVFFYIDNLGKNISTLILQPPRV